MATGFSVMDALNKNSRNFLDVCMDAAKYGNSPDKDISKICKVV